MTVRAILLDVGDTLVRLRPMDPDVASRLAALFGHEEPDSDLLGQCERALTHIRRDIVAGFEEGRLEEHDLRVMLAQAFAQEGVSVSETACERLWDVLGMADIERIDERPGAVAELQRLRQAGYRLAAVSNTTTRPSLLHERFGEWALSDCFDQWVFSAEVGVRKPHPEIYRRALAALGVAGEETVFVGDRVREDVRGPRAAGIAHAILTHEHRQEEPGDSNPCAVILTLDELPTALSRLH